MAKIKITQVKSMIGRPHRQKNTAIALGLTRVGITRVHEATPQILGMVAKIKHVLSVENAE